MTQPEQGAASPSPPVSFSWLTTWGLALGVLAALGDLVGTLITRGERFDFQPATVQIVGPVLLVGAGLAFLGGVVVLTGWRLFLKRRAPAGVLALLFVGLPIAAHLVRDWREEPFPETSVAVETSAGEPPAHVLWVLIDTLRADTTYGDDFSFPHAPNIKRLADDGIVFRAAEASSSWTVPSTATLLTGVHSYSIDANRGYLAPRAPSMAEVLRGAGYQTHCVMDNALIDVRNGFGSGFDSFEKRTPMESAFSLFSWRMIPTAYRESFRNSNNLAYSGAERTADRAIAFLEGDDPRPMFLYAHFIDTHTPYVEHPEFGPPPEGAEEVPFAERAVALLVRSGEREITPGERLMVDHLYSGELRYADKHVGRLIDRFTEKYGAENTLVMLTSDHGEEFWEHGEMGHGMSLYQEVVQVPLVIRPPVGKLPVPQMVSEPVNLVDIMPTTMDLLGMRLAEGQDLITPQGESLVPALASAETPLASNVVSYQNRFKRRIFRWRRGDHVLIEHLPRIVRKVPSGETRYELFDLSTDPTEQVDLSEAHPDLVKELTAELHEFVKRLDADRVDFEALPTTSLDALQALGYAGN